MSGRDATRARGFAVGVIAGVLLTVGCLFVLDGLSLVATIAGGPVLGLAVMLTAFVAVCAVGFTHLGRSWDR